jgi:hypothetical protein
MALVTGLASCGSSHYTYVKNSSLKTYFKVPAGWSEINQSGMKDVDASLNGVDPDSGMASLLKKISWSVGYDAADPAEPIHLLSIDSARPFVYASIQAMTPKEANATSYDTLRNNFLPVTDEAREYADQQGRLFPGFELLYDKVLTPGHGMRGVRTVYNYKFSQLAPLQTIDVTAYASDDGIMYRLIIRCSARCYQDRKSELDTIATSFTVRSRS